MVMVELSVEQVVDRVSGLVCLPEVAIRVNEMVNDGQSSAADIGNIVSRDPGLTAKLLKIANSAIYGFSSQVDSVTRAVTIIGTRGLRDLTLGIAAIRSFEGIPNELVSMANFWNHSVACALAARSLGNACDRTTGDGLFAAGLLHDIGHLVLFHHVPDLSRQALSLVLDGIDSPELHAVEDQLLGFDHAAVGYALARRWHLPDMICECIGFHHEIERAQQYRRETAVVHIANSIAVAAEIGSHDLADVSPIDPAAWALTGLDPERAVTGALDAICDDIEEIKTALNIH